jgi:hypothetical protein
MEEHKHQEEFNNNEDRRLPPCPYAPEWAEHARFNREDAPCDDGRAAQICGSREEDAACPI